MEKTKMGISIEIMAAAVCFLSAINLLAAIFLVGYILIVEMDLWLRRTSVKAIAIALAFSVASICVGSLQDIIIILNSIIAIFTASFKLAIPLISDHVIINILSLIKTIRLLTMGYNSIKGRNSYSGKIDKIIDDHI